MSKNVFVGIAGEWDDRADEHILLTRSLHELEGTTFEYVYVKKDVTSGVDNQVLFRHGVQFVGDFDLENPDICRWLDKQVYGLGYNSFDDFVKDYSPSPVDVKVKPDGRPDRYNNPSYIVDYRALAEALIEVSDEPGIPMQKEEALRLVKAITGFEHEEV